jgi:hypothetical protein
MKVSFIDSIIQAEQDNLTNLKTMKKIFLD